MKFKAKWLDWRALAKDLSNGLNKLTVADNFRSDEFRWKTWTPGVMTKSAMTVSDVVFYRTNYMVMREVCLFQFHVTLTTGGTASNAIYMTMPLASVDPLVKWQTFSMRNWEGGTTVNTYDAFITNDREFYIPARDDYTVNFPLMAGLELRGWGFYEVEG